MLFLRPPEPTDFEGKYVEDIPDLIAEIISPSDTEKRINRRVTQYLDRGVPLVWLIDPSKVVVTVCRPKEFPKVLDETDELTGNGILPDFWQPILAPLERYGFLILILLFFVGGQIGGSIVDSLLDPVQNSLRDVLYRGFV